MRERPWVCVNTAAAASMLAMASLSFADTSNCTAAWGGVGCDDAACQATVCGVDSFCCAVAWDSFCAGEAVSLCGAICGGSCCAAWGGLGCNNAACEAAVCAVDSYCCAVAWDAICASEAGCFCPWYCACGGCPPFSPDLNDDGAVNGADLGIMLGNWGFAGFTDIDGDGTTDEADLDILLGSWTFN
ncbi:MAG: hypothetical protein U0572_03120 [Phycisphaerales bacterium]